MSNRGPVAALALVAFLAGCSGSSGEGTLATSSSAATSTVPTPTATSSTSVAATTSGSSAIAPITGYGDFSGQEFYEIDWFLVNRLTIQCLQENGFPVTVVPPGDGISFHSVPVSQNQLAQQYLEACRAGLNLPEFE